MDTRNNLTLDNPTSGNLGPRDGPVHQALENGERRDELRRFIHSRLRRLGVCQRRLEDQTLETFQIVSMKALERESTFVPNRGSVDAWIRQIADRVIIDEYRKKRRSKVVFRERVEGPLILADPVENLLDSIDLQVREVLATLPKKDQEVFKLSYEEGLKGKELAKALRCSTPAAARVLAFRLRDDFTVGWARVAFRRVDSYEFA